MLVLLIRCNGWNHWKLLVIWVGITMFSSINIGLSFISMTLIEEGGSSDGFSEHYLVVHLLDIDWVVFVHVAAIEFTTLRTNAIVNLKWGTWFIFIILTLVIVVPWVQFVYVKPNVFRFWQWICILFFFIRFELIQWAAFFARSQLFDVHWRNATFDRDESRIDFSWMTIG